MEMLELNETPVRTARNFKINSIQLENVEIPEKVSEFKNVEIKGNCKIDNQVSKASLTYGTGKILEENVYEKANSKIRIITEKNDTIEITYTFDDENINLINEIEIIAEGKSNITIKYKSNTDKACFHNGIIKTYLKENAEINITIVNLLNSESNNFEAIENTLEANSKLNYIIIDIGGKTSISNYYSNILGENADNDLRTIYLGAENQIRDMNYIAELRGKKSNINMDVQGALQGNCKKHFKGTIDFKKGCKKSKGNENEYCMLLSDNAKSISLPMLLCAEEDVEGNHGVASGKVNRDELFYIMSRGFEYKQAVKLIVRAKFNEIIERIIDEDTKNEVINEIDRRLDK